MQLKRHFLIWKQLFLLVNCLRCQKLNFRKLTSRNRNQSKTAANDVELKSRVLNFSLNNKFGKMSSNADPGHGLRVKNPKSGKKSNFSNLVQHTVFRLKNPRRIDLSHQKGRRRLLILLSGHFNIGLAQFISKWYISAFKSDSKFLVVHISHRLSLQELKIYLETVLALQKSLQREVVKNIQIGSQKNHSEI